MEAGYNLLPPTLPIFYNPEHNKKVPPFERDFITGVLVLICFNALYYFLLLALHHFDVINTADVIATEPVELIS